MSEQWGTISATKHGETVDFPLYPGQNSFGEADVFVANCNATMRREFMALRGYPLYAVQQWLVDRGYTYEVK